MNDPAEEALYGGDVANAVVCIGATVRKPVAPATLSQRPAPVESGPGGDRWVFIDWDGAGPGSRLWDLGHVAEGFVPLWARGDPHVCGRRLRRLADAYGLDERQRRQLPGVITAHTRGMFDLLHLGCDRPPALGSSPPGGGMGQCGVQPPTSLRPAHRNGLAR
jgi:hypothetical protein